MKRVIKLFAKKDQQGKSLLKVKEEVIDEDSRGITYSKESIVLTCETCSRPLENAGDMRGKCDYCRKPNRLCVSCTSVCLVCGKTLCPDHKRGFAKGLTCCPTCYDFLIRMKEEADRKSEESIEFERYMVVQKHRLEILQSRFFDNFPGINIIRQIFGMRQLKNIQALEEEIRRRLEE